MAYYYGCTRYYYYSSWGPPVSKEVVCQSNRLYDRLIGGSRLFLFTPVYGCDSPDAPGDFDHLISGYRLTYSPFYSDHLVEGSLCNLLW